MGLTPTVFYFCAMKNLFNFIITSCIIFSFISCSSDSDEDIDQIPQFDRSSILKNYADNIIIPRYSDFQSEVLKLKSDIENFTKEPNTINYDKAHNSWFETYKKWQHVEMFNIGKAEQIMYLNTINTYPVDELRINNNINSKKLDLSNENDWSCQGLSGIDFMLHGVEGTKEEIIEKYLTDPNYSDYLNNLIEIISNNTNTIVEDWTTNYKDTFIQSSGNSNSSSLNMLTNDFVYYFEKGLRTNKIGIPVGYFSGGNTLAEKVETYYSSKNSIQNVSRDLAAEALIASENLFIGKSSSDSTGPSLKSYLDYLYSSNVNENNLSPIILNNFQKAKTAINELDENFIDQINNDKSKMLNAFDKLQSVVVNMKTDMLSILSIQVDYIDADGD